MPPKCIYYAAANFSAVTTGLLTPLWGYGRLPRSVIPLVFIVCLIGFNLLVWYLLRRRARAALATDETSANDKPKISRRTRTFQFLLIGSGLFVLAVSTVFTPFDKTNILDVLCALFAIGYGAILGIRVHKIGPK